MKKLSELSKVFIVYLMIFSLVHTSLPYQAQAAPVEENPFFDLTRTAMGLYGQMLGQKQNTIRQQILMQKNQQMMQQYSPNCRKPDGTSCFTVQGKFFPECPLPASMSNMPENACMGATPDPNQISSMIVQEMLAKSWTNYYDQMSNEASNSAVPFGLKCLQDKQKAVDSQITEMINNLTRLQDRLNQDKQIFRDNNKKLLDELAVANEELFGGSGKKDLGLKTMDFSKYFSPACQSAIGKETMSEAGKIGFSGILQTMGPKNKSAADYNQNRALIESDIRRDVEKMQANIQKNGLADWMNIVKTPAGGSDVSSLATVKSAASKHLMEFEITHNRIQTDLKKEFGYEIPKMDKNFATDFGSFLTTSKDHFKKKFINECVTGADKGVAIPLEDVLKSMTTKIKGSVGQDYLNNYRSDYKNILESSSSVEEKQIKLAELNKTKPNITLTYRNSQGQFVESPYNTFMKTVAKCEEKYTSNDAVSVDRGQVLLRELQAAHDNFASNLGQSVMEKVMNCNGEAKKSGAACNEESLNHKSENFCMAQAGQCANEIIGCYAEANKQVETRKTKMGALAKTYNANVTAMIARSNQLYEQQKVAVTELTKVIQARFPGTNFNIPGDMFISMPEMKKDAYGVELANDGNLSYMDELPKKIGLLKQMFEEQKVKTNEVIEDYIGKQKMAMERERARWDKMANECKNHIERSSQELAKMNAEGQKRQQEMDAKVGGWCRKYAELKSHPNGACEKAKKLSEDVDKISAYITNKARGVTAEYNDTCNSFNNEKDQDNYDICMGLDESDKDDKKEYRKKRCDAVIARYNKENNAPSTSKKLRLAEICPDKDKTEDSDLFKKLAELSPSAKDKEEVAKISEASELSAALGSFENAGFFEQLSEFAAKDVPLCSSLIAASNSQYDKDSYALDKEEISNSIQALESEKKALTDKDKDKVTKIEGDIIKRKNDLIALKKKERSDLENSKKSGAVKELLSSFYPAVSVKDVKMQKLSDIGERVDESCNAQASNNMMPKVPGSASFLQNYDNAILGKQQ